MFRHVITAYLIAIALPGPGLCCCSAARVFATIYSQPTSSDARMEVGQCCCHSTKDDRSSTKPDSCPCRKARENRLFFFNDECSASSADASVPKQSQPNFESASADFDVLYIAGHSNHFAQQAFHSRKLDSLGSFRAFSVMRC